MGQLWPRLKPALKFEKFHKRTSSGQGGRGDRRNDRNNTRDSSESTRKYYKGLIEGFGAVLTLKYEKVELKKPFDVFREKLINSTIKLLNNAKDVLVLVQVIEDLKASFDTKNEREDLNKSEAKYKVKNLSWPQE